VQRESEGAVVASFAATKNAAGAKGPSDGRAVEAATPKGMPEGANHPGRMGANDHARRLQRRLDVAAKQRSGRRFRALMDRIWTCDVLEEAWQRARRSHGSAGVGATALAENEQRRVGHFLEEVALELRAGECRPMPVLRRYTPESDGKQRQLGIPTVRDRVVQMATKLVLQPIFEADSRPCSYGFRPKCSPTQALETLRVQGRPVGGGNHVMDADIRDYFGSIDHDKLMKHVERRISDRRVLKLLRQWLTAGVMEEGSWSAANTGTPQGGVISPLIYKNCLHLLDVVRETRCARIGTLVRYANDFVVMCKTKENVEEAEKHVRVVLATLGLELHPDTTRKVELSGGLEGFDFLGCHLRKRMSGPIRKRERKRVYFLNRLRCVRSIKRVRQRVKAMTPRWRCYADPRVVIEELNPVLGGWGNDSRTGNPATKFNQLDAYVWRRHLARRVKRKVRNLRAQGNRVLRSRPLVEPFEADFHRAADMRQQDGTPERRGLDRPACVRVRSRSGRVTPSTPSGCIACAAPSKLV
jgi:group II intron reverse transcriptase/maturase